MSSDWESSKGIAKAILHNREMRRRWLGRWLLMTIVWIALGLWVFDSWIGDEAWRFFAWWGSCAVMAVVLMIFALYDALAVVREERGSK